MELALGALIFLGLPAAPEMRVGEGGVTVCVAPNSAPAAVAEFSAWDGLKRPLADSSLRGVPLELPAEGDLVLELASAGLRRGEERWVFLVADGLPRDLGGIVPRGTDVGLRLTGG